MATHIVTEGVVEQAMVRRLVREHAALKRHRIPVYESSLGNPTSLARTILSVKHEPVAVILSTKTQDRASISEQRGLAEWHVGTAGLREDWEVLLVVPEFTVLLFQDEQVLRSLLPKPPTFEQRIVARYEPTRMLSEIFTQAGKPFPKALTQRLARTNLAPLWRLPVLQPLERFLLGSFQAQHAGEPA